jgi:chorismate mutase / prephenate dehydratase
MTERLEDARALIDRIDVEIVDLLNHRARLGLEAGRAKARAGLPLTDPEREREVLARVAAANGGPLPTEYLVALYAGLIETVRSLEERGAEDWSPDRPRLEPHGQAR